MSRKVKNNQEFIKEDMKEFLEKIVEEHSRQNQNIILVPVSKDSYWVYKLLRPEMSENISHVRVWGYKYLSQPTAFEEISPGTCVILFDLHVVSDDEKLYSYYKLLKQEGITDVYAYAYGVSTEYLRKLEQGVLNRSKRERRYPYFRDELKWRKYSKIYDPSEASHISIMEMKWIHNALLPFKENSPVVKCKNEISLSEWEVICRRNAYWEFIQTNSLIDSDVLSGFFILNINDSITERFNNSISYFFVNCTYKIEKGKVYAVFVPCAIASAFYSQDIWQCFETLFKETEYFEEIMQFMEKKYIKVKEFCENQNLAAAITEAVICFLNIFNLMEFKEMLSKIIKKELSFDLDVDIMKENNMASFVNTINKIWTSYKLLEVYNKILGCKKMKKVVFKYDTIDRYQTQKATQDKIENHIQFRMIKTGSIPLVTMEKEIDDLYLFYKLSEKKAFVIGSFLMLEKDYRISSRISSKIGLELERRRENIIYKEERRIYNNKTYLETWEIQEEDNVIYWEIQAEDNCDILFYDDFIYLYDYAFALFFSVPYYEDRSEDDGSEYKNNISNILQKAEAFMTKNETIAIIDQDHFPLYKEYLMSLEDPRNQIMNKMYLLEPYEEKTMKLGQRLIIKDAFENIEYWL